MNEQLEKEAENLFPIRSTGSPVEMLDRHQLNNSLRQEGFIAGVNSKATEIKVLKAQIEIYSECLEFIDENHYEKEIIRKIQKTEQQLKDLEKPLPTFTLTIDEDLDSEIKISLSKDSVNPDFKRI